jgi:hypothetical protein
MTRYSAYRRWLRHIAGYLAAALVAGVAVASQPLAPGQDSAD